MADISAKAVMALREKMGVSMMACKKALVEADGNEEKAIEILRKSGIAKAAKKSDRTTGEGKVAFSSNAIVKVNCETDFVAGNEGFITFVDSLVKIAEKDGAKSAEEAFEAQKNDMITKLGENLSLGGVGVLEEGNTFGGFAHFNGKIASVVALEGGNSELASEIAMHVVAMNPAVLSPDDADEALLAKEKDIWTAELKNQGKPEQIIGKIMEGKEKKFRGENALLTQPFVKDGDVKIAQLAEKNGAKVIGFLRFEI